MASDLNIPGDLELSYNGFDFPSRETEPLHISITPNLDPAGRTVVSTTYNLTFRSWIATDVENFNDTSIQMADLRQRLTQQAGQLKVTGCGFGDLIVNPTDGNGVYDVKWGPIPKILDSPQIGADQCWKIIWQVEVTIPGQCKTPRDAGPMAFTYGISWDQDQGGYTRRVYTGELMIPLTRGSVNDRTVNETADKYFEKCLIPLPDGFRREVTSRQLDPSRRKLTFTVTDTELKGYAPPPDVVTTEVRRTVECKGPIFLRPYVSLTGRYEMARGVSKSAAFVLFKALYMDSMANTNKLIPATGNGKLPGAKAIPLHLSISGGDLHGAEAGTFTYRYYYCLPPDKMRLLLESAGVWRIPPGANSPAAWSKSMLLDVVTAPRGHAKLTFNPADDHILDLCEPSSGSMLNAAPPAAAIGAPKKNDVLADNDNRPDPSNPLSLKAPPPAQSWIDYRNTLTIVQVDNVAIHQPLPTNANPVKYTPQPPGLNATNGFVPGWKGPQPIIQRRGAPLVFAVLTGYGLRAGYAVTPPNITAVSGVPATPVNNGSDYYICDVVANMGIPVYRGKWSRRYILSDVPQIGIMPPDHPLFGSAPGDDRLDGFLTGS